MTLRKFLSFFEFDYKIEKDEDGVEAIKLIDMAGTNLGNIESDIYYDVIVVVDRLDIYYHDYIYTDICEEHGYTGEEYYPDILEYAEKNDVSYKDIIYFIVHGDELEVEEWKEQEASNPKLKNEIKVMKLETDVNELNLLRVEYQKETFDIAYYIDKEDNWHFFYESGKAPTDIDFESQLICCL